MGLLTSLAIALGAHWYLPRPSLAATGSTPSDSLVDRVRLPDHFPRPAGMSRYVQAWEFRSFAKSYAQIHGRTYVPERSPADLDSAPSPWPQEYVAHIDRAGWPFSVFECVNRVHREVPQSPAWTRESLQQAMSGTLMPAPPVSPPTWIPEYVDCVVWTPPRPTWLMVPNRPYVAVSPTRPLVLGLAADTAFWAFVLAGVAACARASRARRRRRSGRCVRCAYPLAGLAACPECGTKTACAGSPASS
jgi:hypothetical protein